MNPIIIHGLANGALLGGAMGLSSVGSLTATIVGNVLFLAFVLAATVSALALVADHWAMKKDKKPLPRSPETSPRLPNKRRLGPAIIR